MDDRTQPGPHCAAQAGDAVGAVMRYHEQTKHHFFRYARSLGYLDWANQPDPFRRYARSPLVPLPRLAPDDLPLSPRYEDLYRARAVASEALGVFTLSRFLECSLAITAWKQAGDVRWALRANPSSGNLHPTEGYLLLDEVAGLSACPGVHHYAAGEHALELRAEWPDGSVSSLLHGFPRDAFLLGLTSVNWRETWKYGERAFRYCQHDVGHALGAARIAAQMLGWRMLLLEGVSDDTLAALLGIDRAEDFETAEREHPGCLAVIWPADRAGGPAAPGTVSLPLFIEPAATRDLPPRIWHGRANRLSRDDPVPWPLVHEVEVASWKPNTERSVVVLRGDDPEALAPGGASAPAPSVYPGQPRAATVIRQRRSALAFDRTTSISVGSFFTMLGRVMPRVERDLGRRPMPWDAVPWPSAIHLALFVHRVAGLAPGLYLLVRDVSQARLLRHATYQEYAWTPPPGCPADLPLFLLQQADLQPIAAQLSCGQAIAADGAFSLAMIAEFESSLRLHGPWFYRRLHWESGMIGQILYLEAEAIGLRATGIGCFFDDPVHQVMGFADTAFQSLYHFTSGGAVEDPRLTTLPPYGKERS